MPHYLDGGPRQTTLPRPVTPAPPVAARTAVEPPAADPPSRGGAVTGGGRESSSVQELHELQDRVRELEETVEQLTGALRTRPPIEHVVGMLMVTGPTSAETAWKVLSKVSQDTNSKVRDLVTVITADVANGYGLPPRVLRALRDLTTPH